MRRLTVRAILTTATKVLTPILPACLHPSLPLHSSRVDLKNQLCGTDYYEVLHEEGGKLTATVLANRLRDHYVREFRYLRSVASGNLVRFFDYISYGYMIDNVVLLIAGTLRSFDAFGTGGGREDVDELLARCHPLGMFDTMPALLVATSVDEIYNTVLVESPLAPYFRGCFSADDLDEVHIELIRNHLWKAYLEDFYAFVSTSSAVNAETSALMRTLLAFEADRRIISIAVNACGSERLGKEERMRLFPRFGTLWEAGVARKMAFVDDLDQIRVLLEPFPAFRLLLSDYMLTSDDKLNMSATGSTSTTSYELPPTLKNRSGTATIANTQFSSLEPRTMEEHFFEHEVSLCKEAFDHQFTFAIFYAWSRLKEQEIRNIVWIAECIGQNQRQNIHSYIPIF